MNLATTAARHCGVDSRPCGFLEVCLERRIDNLVRG